jgi:hypothetical protein
LKKSGTLSGLSCPKSGAGEFEPGSSATATPPKLSEHGTLNPVDLPPTKMARLFAKKF